ncbi:MAG: C4-dicarboxylate ABC transporter substrate-binding protein [Hyphomicrobiaceae bacterium]|nr:C4-dicarboxylate ABC transporter substrate-binding protein [Hyphomicrobiaceae bacterium]
MRVWRSALGAVGAAVLFIVGTVGARAQGEAGSPPPPAAIMVAQAAAPLVPARRVQRAIRTDSESRRKEAINSNTVGLAAGRIEGAPLQFAGELARVLDDGDNMRVLPIVTRGIFDNVFDLLYLRGVDAAIVYGDVLEHFKKTPEIAGISRRINYLASLFPSELHIFVRPEITSLKDLEGKVVNFNTEGTAAAYSGPIIFERLGIKIDAKFNPHSVAMQEMRKGPAYAATVWVSSKPLAPFLKGQWPEGFKFLPVTYSDALEYYLPAYLDHEDYPALIQKGQRVSTIAVPAVLAVYDWPADTERYRRMVRFVDYLFQRLPQLQTNPGYHKNWKDVNLAASVPGWKRFAPLQERLDKTTREKQATAAPAAPSKAAAAAGEGPQATIDAARQQAARAAPNDPAEQERLFKEFMEWRSRQGGAPRQ